MNRRRGAAIRRESMAAERIPCCAHVAAGVVKTTYGDYLQVLRLGGASFESADIEQINSWHDRLNVLWRNVSSPNVALWVHTIRRRIVPDALASNGGFADALAAKYRRRLAHQALMINELFLSVLYRPAAGVTRGAVARFLSNVEADSARVELSEALEACEKLSGTLCAALSAYEPEPLGCYRSGPLWCSSLLEFLGLLVNGEWRPVPLPRCSVSEALATTRLHFGAEAIEYRTPTGTQFGAVLGIKEYPTPTVAGMFNRLLAAPFPLVLTQSFTFLGKQTSQGLLQRQFHRMRNAGDFAVSQAEELKAALDALTSNEFVMGDHHFSLQVLCDLTDDGADSTDSQRLKGLNERVAVARSLLADTGMTVAREDLALEAAFWAQIPGNFPMRPRKAPITSRNFAAMAAFHNYPAGRATGNHWGPALAMFMTTARSPYYFSLHAGAASDRDPSVAADTGHTFICGPTGSGKTVFMGFLMTMLARQGVTQIVFDKDHGLEILVRALGGEYLPLKNGLPTGFNPLQLPDGPTHLEFLKSWVRTLVRCGPPLSVRQQEDLDQALHGTLALDRSMRRLSRLIEFLDPTDPEGAHARLLRWCESSGGDYAWVFDHAQDSVLSRMHAPGVIGFDVTDFLEHDVARPPVILYLFHLVRQLLDGRRLVCWLDEFWRLLADPAFEGFAREAPKTWRKLNGVLCAATQSASDVLDSPISRTIVEQTPTKVFFPNLHASAAEYTGLGLSAREFLLVKEQLAAGSRRFLVKQGGRSVVCQLDLGGFGPELAVISGRASSLKRMESLRASHGPDARHWLSAFMRQASDASVDSRPPPDEALGAHHVDGMGSHHPGGRA